MKETCGGHEKLTDRQMDGQTDDQCLDIQLAIPTSNALPICIIYFFDLLINAGKTLIRHETVLYNSNCLKIKYTSELVANCPTPTADTANCTTIHRYSIFSTRYSVMCKVYTGYCGTSEIEHGLCACTVDNPLAKARGLSLRTGAQTMLYLSLVVWPMEFPLKYP